MTAPKIVGLDVSLTSTGYSFDTTLGCIQSKRTGVSRMIEIRDIVDDMFSDENYDTLFAIEGFSMGSKNSRAHDIGGLGWIIRVQLHEMGFAYVDVPPTSLKKFATGKGNASKDEVVSSISARTGIVFSGKGANDMCDAWVLREMLTVHKGLPGTVDWPKINLAALGNVDWTSVD